MPHAETQNQRTCLRAAWRMVHPRVAPWGRDLRGDDSASVGRTARTKNGAFMMHWSTLIELRLERANTRTTDGQMWKWPLSYDPQPSQSLSTSTSAHSVVVITSALHAEGPRFEPGRDQNFFYFSIFFHIHTNFYYFLSWFTLLRNLHVNYRTHGI